MNREHDGFEFTLMENAIASKEKNLNALASPRLPSLIKLVMKSVNFSSRVLFKKSTWMITMVLFLVIQ